MDESFLDEQQDKIQKTLNEAKKREIDLKHYTGCIGSTYPQKYYLGMAHQETAGICLEWLKKNVLYHEEQLKAGAGVPNIYELLDTLAEKVGPAAGGLIFTPRMFGERSPLDDETVRAGLFNVSLNHSREHIIRPCRSWASSAEAQRVRSGVRSWRISRTGRSTRWIVRNRQGRKG
jgi:ribulose kinase